MEAVNRTNVQLRLPDIHRTSRRGNQTTADTSVYGGGQGNGDNGTEALARGYEDGRRLPTVVVRDVVGRKLDLTTSYQRAIYEAKWRLAHGELPKNAEEWRLPHAPLPARPDLTRTAPPLVAQRIYRKELRATNKLSQSQPEFSDTIDTDKGFENLRLSLLQAETLPPLAGAELINLNSARQPVKTYLPFVAAAPSTIKTYVQTDIREAEYVFPGFCSGCSKGTGLCYGCDRDPNPHYHKDKVARTGGGFVYLKHDRAYGLIESNNPANWNVPIPDSERVRTLPYPEHPGLLGHPQWLPSKPKGLPPTAYVYYDGVEHPDFKKYGHKVSVVRLRDGTVEKFVEEVGYPYDPDKPDTASRIATYLTDTGYEDMSTRVTTTDDNSVIRVETGYPPDTLYEQYLSTLKEDSTLTEMESEVSKKGRDSTRVSTESVVSRRSKEKPLYKAPPAFKPKSSDKEPTKAADPFSKDRQYNIPTGSGLEIKHSDKPLTEFEEFRFGEGDWQERTFKSRARTDVTPEPTSRPAVKVTEGRRSKSDITEAEPRNISPHPSPPPPTGETETKTISLEKPKEDIQSAVSVEDAPKSKTPDSVSADHVTSVSEATLTEPEDRSNTKSAEQEITRETPSSPRSGSPLTDSDSTSQSTKREKRTRPPIVKKERRQREPPVRKSRRPSVKDVIEEEPEPVKEKPLTPEPQPKPEPEDEPESEPEPEAPPMVFKEHSLPTPPPMRKVPPPPLPRAAPPIPPLPREYTDIEKPQREVSQTLIEAPPPMFEPPNQRRPPPIKRPKAKSRERRVPLIRQSEVPKEQPDIKLIMDPLDYLAKYCIIHKDRLPHYERVFNKVIKEQPYRYADVPHSEDRMTSEGGDPERIESEATAQPIKTRLTEDEERMINNFALINRSTREEYAMVGYNIGDQNVQKVNFTLDTLINKYEELQEKHDKLQADRILMIADLARKMFPEVLRPNFKGEKKKKKKKKKKKTSAKDESLPARGSTAEAGVQTEDTTKEKIPLTDVDIVRRLTDRMLDEISTQPEVAHINLEIERLQEKLRDVDDRIEDLEDEKKLLQLYSRDLYLRDITQNKRDPTFLRRQSALYQKLHPNEDPEMNLNELEDALQQINGHLISEKELQFIYHILDLKSRRRINLQLFSVVAALSEKVKQVDPFIRKLINKFNYEALNVKMDRSKELFWLLDTESDDVPSGKITASNLAVELAAGGVSPEHAQFVVNKFNRECKGTVDFLDYLTYVPLFIELHGRIVDDPLSNKRTY